MPNVAITIAAKTLNVTAFGNTSQTEFSLSLPNSSVTFTENTASNTLSFTSNVYPNVNVASAIVSMNANTTSNNFEFTITPRNGTGPYIINVPRKSSTGHIPATANVINVTNLTQLLNAIDTVNSVGGYRNIVVASGTYTIPETLVINVPNVSIYSATGVRTDVIIQGDAMSSSADVGNIIRISRGGCAVRGVTLRRGRWSGIQLSPDAGRIEGFHAYNVLFQDTYEHHIKVAVVGSDGSSNGLVELCTFEYTAGQAPNYYTGGIDVHRGNGWIVRDNLFRDIASPSLTSTQHAINFWNASANNIFERNKIIDCDRGIGSGLNGNPANDGDIIRNNMIYHSNNGDSYADVGIGVENATNCKVYNNTVYFDNSFPWTMEYRFTTTGTEFRNNLANKGIQLRDGGTATLANNVTNAQSSYFVDRAAGDLRLASSVAGVVNSGATLSGFSDDYEGSTRPKGSSWDIGAHEYG